MKTVSKKLLSLLLVAIMLVAAMPFAAFADGGEKTNVTVVGQLSDGTKIYETTLATMSESFDTANKEHLNNAFAYGNPGITVDTDKYTIVSGSYDEAANKLTVILEAKAAPAPTPATYTVKITGDASATGSKQIDAPTEADFETNYGAVVAALNNAGLSEYTNADNWTIKTITKDDTAHVITVSVAKKTPATEPTEPSVTYTVTVTVEGTKVADGVQLEVKSGSNVDVQKPQDVLNALKLNYTYDNYTTKSYSVSGTTITMSMSGKKEDPAPEIEVTVSSNGKTWTKKVTVGTYYSSYSDFTPADKDGRTATYLMIDDGNADNVRMVNVGSYTNAGIVKATDKRVSIQWKANDRKVEFCTDSTRNKVYKTITVYAGKALGELPTNVNGKEVDYWTVDNERIYSTTTYEWNADSVKAVPHFKGESNGKIYLDIYVNGNRTSLYRQADITTSSAVQDGFVYRDKLLSIIRSELKNNNLKLSSVSYLFTEAEWSLYVRDTKNTTTNDAIYVGTDLNDARYIYVMVNGVTTKTTDPSNPKTGDNVKLGVAAAVLAVAVVGFGAVTVVNKKKGVQ